MEERLHIGTVIEYQHIVRRQVYGGKILINRLYQFSHSIIQTALVEKISNGSSIRSIGGSKQEFLPIVLVAYQFNYGCRSSVSRENLPFTEHDMLL